MRAQPFSGSMRAGGPGPRTRIVVTALIVATFAGAGCGGEKGGESGGGDGERASIERSLRAYFVFDRSPDLDAYCRSFINVHNHDTFRHGSPSDLARDARVTETRCRILHPSRTGWPDARIGMIKQHGDRARAGLTYRIRPHGIISRGAQLARIGKGDWRILLAGYD
jgi:hypothetical protein